MNFVTQRAGCPRFTTRASLQLLMHDKMDSLRAGQWESAPHPHWYAMIGPRIRNRPTLGASTLPPSTPPSSVPPASTPPSSLPPASTTTFHPSASYRDGLCFWYLAGCLGLTARSGRSFRCSDPSHPPHVPLNTVRYLTVRQLLKDDDFMAACHNPSVRESLRTAVKANKQSFLP